MGAYISLLRQYPDARASENDDFPYTFADNTLSSCVSLAQDSFTQLRQLPSLAPLLGDAPQGLLDVDAFAAAIEAAQVTYPRPPDGVCVPAGPIVYDDRYYQVTLAKLADLCAAAKSSGKPLGWMR